MRQYALILYLSLMSCASYVLEFKQKMDVVVLDQDLKPYWDHFNEKVMKKYNIPFVLDKLIIAKNNIPNNNILGFCEVKERESVEWNGLYFIKKNTRNGFVVINEKTWELNEDVEWRNTLMVHELAHCLLKITEHSPNIPFMNVYLKIIPLDNAYEDQLFTLVKNSCTYYYKCKK